MRRKTPHVVVTFSTTSDAMAAQAASDKGVLPGRMIPAPSEVSAGCGLAWCAPAGAREELLRALSQERLAFEGVFEVDFY